LMFSSRGAPSGAFVSATPARWSETARASSWAPRCAVDQPDTGRRSRVKRGETATFRCHCQCHLETDSDSRTANCHCQRTPLGVRAAEVAETCGTGWSCGRRGAPVDPILPPHDETEPSGPVADRVLASLL